MRIKEVAAETRLTERAIRLYEEHGLISPSVTEKNGRDFRDYSDTDVKKLKTIASLRRALFTIDEIKLMESRPESIPAVVTEHQRRMHIDFQNLAYLVDHIDRVDADAVTSTDQLASEIFAPTSRLSHEKHIPTEEEKILFSEQYSRIYDKYFAENTGWDKRYSASLAVSDFFDRFRLGKILKICGIMLTVLIIGAVVCYGIADVEKVEYELSGSAYYYGDPEKTETVDIRIEGRYKNYLLRGDQFEGIVYIDGYCNHDRTPFKSSFVVSEKGCAGWYSTADKCSYLAGTLLSGDYAIGEDGKACLISLYARFDGAFKLLSLKSEILPQVEGQAGSFTRNEYARDIFADVDGDIERAKRLFNLGYTSIAN